MALGVHVDVVAFARIGLGLHARQACCNDDRLQQVGIRRAIRQAELEATRTWNANHMCAVVTGPRHRVRRPRCTGHSARRVDALIGVDGRVSDRRQRAGVVHDPTEEGATARGQAQLHILVSKDVGFAVLVPHRNVYVTAVAGQARNWLGHERGAVAVLFRY